MELLEGPIRDYEWGSPTWIPELIGRPATGAPVAELWLGAHPSAPALVGCDHVPLDQMISSDLESMLGPDIADRFGALPFLLKVLAAEAPLSLQAHPSRPQAEAGFEREEADGLLLDAPQRSFRDRSHKPELVCALTEFRALCGFRDPSATLDLLSTIEAPTLEPVAARLAADPTSAGLRALLEWLLGLDPTAARALADPVGIACGPGGPSAFAKEREMAAALSARYPGDAGVVTALLLNLVILQPGEALFLGAGNLHAYLSGSGVEIMANSDNVVRAGLTAKHVDIATLLEIVDVTPIVPDVQRPALVRGVATYAAPVEEFSLVRIELDGETAIEAGPAVLLCVAGRAEIGDQTLDTGGAAWVSASDGPATLRGRATVFRAGVGAG